VWLSGRLIVRKKPALEMGGREEDKQNVSKELMGQAMRGKTVGKETAGKTKPEKKQQSMQNSVRTAVALRARLPVVKR